MKQKKSEKFVYNWGGEYPLYLVEASIYRYKIVDEYLKGLGKKYVINYRIKKEWFCYSSVSDQINLYKASQKFLQPDYRKNFFQDAMKVCNDYKQLENHLKKIVEQRLSLKTLISVFNECVEMISFILCFFEMTRPEFQRFLTEKLEQAIHDFPDKQKNILLQPSKLDAMTREYCEWLNLVSKKPDNDQLLGYAQNHLWIFPGAKNNKDLLYYAKKRYQKTGKIDARKAKAEIKKINYGIQVRRKKQNQILGKNREMREVINLFHQLGLVRVELKKCWESIRFFMDNILWQISKEKKVRYDDLFYHYQRGELEKLVLKNKKIPILQRINYLTYIYKNGKVGFYESHEAAKKQQLVLKQFEMKEELTGMTAFPGRYHGRVVIVPHADIKALSNCKFSKGDILVTTMTQPNMVLMAKKAGAIITDEGGISSHAAIIAREFKIPSVIGTRVATQILKTGDRVEVDAFRGIVRKLK